MSAIRRLALAFGVLVAAGVFLLAAPRPAGAVERILRFVSDVKVERNGDLIVTETIAVQAEGKDIRRGILRDFPTSYTRRDGAHVEVGFDVQFVSRDGTAESFVTERLSNGVRVRIGSADRFLNSGRHEYVIRYRTTRQIGFFADYDELYWNATGTGWTFAIDQAEARITLPEGVPFRQTALYTGPQDARGQDATIVEQRPGYIVFRTTKPLPARNGLTVAAAWQKGVVTPPDAAQQATWLLQDNKALGGTIIPLFGPPAGMSAAAVRYVDRMGFDNKVFTAALIELGVNGHIKLIDRGKDTQIERRSGGKTIGRPETELEAKLLGASPSLLLTQTNHEKISAAKNALEASLRQSYRNKLFTNNYGWSWLGLLLAIGLVVAIAVTIANTYGTDNAPGAIWGMLIPIIPIMVGANLIQSGWRKRSGGALQLISGVVTVALAAAIGLSLMYAYSRGFIEVLPGVAPAVLASFTGLAFGWLQAPSVEGRKIMDQIDGLREYLGVAEEERLEYLNPPEKTPETFERFLPYAVALDLENTWAKRFADVLAAAAAGAAAGQAASSWYSGDHDIARDPVSFTERIGDQLSSTIASSSTAPGSNDSGGSSGGGSSGGGGGGGGGSGW